MCGNDPQTVALFNGSLPEERVPPESPLRTMRARGDRVLKELSPQFDLRCSHTGRPSIVPEQLWRVLWLLVRYPVRGGCPHHPRAHRHPQTDTTRTQGAIT
jgi:hypothetical protein